MFHCLIHSLIGYLAVSHLTVSIHCCVVSVHKSLYSNHWYTDEDHIGRNVCIKICTEIRSDYHPLLHSAETTVVLTKQVRHCWTPSTLPCIQITVDTELDMWTHFASSQLATKQYLLHCFLVLHTMQCWPFFSPCNVMTCSYYMPCMCSSHVILVSSS